MKRPASSSNHFDPLFNPSYVAIVGASSVAGKAGNIILANLLKHGYSGKIFPVNPNEDKVLRLEARKNMSEIEGSIDLALICVPAPAVPGVVKDCAARKVKFAIIISAGFEEAGEEGKKVQNEVVKAAREGGMRLIGPNCIGMINSHRNLMAVAVPFERWRRSSISMIAQSGLFAGALAKWVMDTQHFGIGKSITLGNKCDVDEVDLLKDYFKDDDETRVLCMYIENITDGARFVNVCTQITKDKPVIVVKSGRTTEGIKAAATHTGALAIDDKLVDSAFRQSGVIRAESFQELMDLARCFDSQPLPKGNRVGVVTLSGASGVLITDVINRLGLRLAELSSETKSKINEQIMPPWQPVTNPVDIWIALGAGPEEAHEVALSTLTQDTNVDAVIAVLLALPPAYFDVRRVFSALKKYLSRKPIAVAIIGDTMAEKWIADLERLGVPAFEGPASAERAAKCISALHLYNQYLMRVRDIKKTRSA